MQQIDASLERAIQAYDGATYHLGRIESSLRSNSHDLGIAQDNLRQAQATLAQRVVAVYTTGSEQMPALDVLFGSTSLDDLMNRLDTVNRVSNQDAAVTQQVGAFRNEVQRREQELRRAHVEQARIVASRSAERASIQQQLAQRQQLLSSIKGQIAHLQAVERARELAVAHEAQRRLAAEQAAAQAAAQAQAATQAQPATAAATGTPATDQAATAPAPAPVVGVSADTPEGATVAPPSQYGGVVGIAMQYLGTPYVWGGASPSGFDCSGLVQYVFAQVGVALPHYTGAQYGMGSPVSRDQLEPGDLVFFDGLGHVGIYIGGDQFIHAPHTGDVVKISSMSESWYASTYVGARRI